MKLRSLARAWHGTTAAVAGFALLVQLALVCTGASVLVDGPQPPLGTRLVRLVSYFTIQSNLLVGLTAVSLTLRPGRDGRLWRVLRLASTVGIAITGIVHWFLLRPLLHLTGWSYATDRLLHLVVPVLAVVGWLLFGPRRRVDGRTVLVSLGWPVAWLVATMLVGGATGWYPYPFLDLPQVGMAAVGAAVAGVTGLFLLLAGAVWVADARLPA